MQLCNWNRKELILHLVSKKKKKGLFGDTLSLTTSHLLLLDVTPVKNIKNTEMAIKILKNGKKNTESTEPRLEALYWPSDCAVCPESNFFNVSYCRPFRTVDLK